MSRGQRSPRQAASTILLAALLAAAGLAGCLGDDPGPSDSPGDREGGGSGTDRANASLPARTTVEIEGCIGYSVQAGIPWDAVAQALPEGFEPVPFAAPGPSPPSQARMAQAFFDGWHCQNATADNQTVEDIKILLPKVEVEPPEELAPPGEQRSYIPLFSATDADLIAETFSSWGWLAEAGQPVVETTGAGPARSGHVQGSAGVGAIDARVTIPQPPMDPPTVGNDTTRYFLTEPALFEGETPTVTGIVNRTTTTATASLGEGHVAFDGALEKALGPAAVGRGFDTQDGNWGETFRLVTLNDV